MNTFHKTLIVATLILAGGTGGCYERVVNDNSVDAQFSRSMQAGAVHSGAGTPRDWNAQNDTDAPDDKSNFRPGW
jgi:hypothetical protein